MLTEERRRLILEELTRVEIVKSTQLMKLLNASESTIRRDLQEMESEGLLLRIHGGAKRKTQLEFEQDMREKSSKNIQEKHLIASFASHLVNQNDVIYLDAGTTTLEMIPYLIEKNISVVTNSVLHASILADYLIPTIILGGSIKLTTKATLGSLSIQQLSQYSFNKAFVGANGVHKKYGFTTPDVEEATLKHLALERAEEKFILCDHTKFNQVTFSKIIDLSEATIITDSCPSETADYHKLTTIKEVAK